MNPISITPNLYSAAITLGIMAALAGGGYLAGDVHGSHKAELACANQRADASEKSIVEWKDAATEQTKKDLDARKTDRAETQAALAAAGVVADRFAAMKVSIVKLNPPGECTLSPAWIQAYNDAK